MALAAVTKLTNTCSEVEKLLFIGVSLGLEASHIFFNLHENMRERLLSLFPDEKISAEKAKQLAQGHSYRKGLESGQPATKSYPLNNDITLPSDDEERENTNSSALLGPNCKPCQVSL